jgi:hypothetical protein
VSYLLTRDNMARTTQPPRPSPSLAKRLAYFALGFLIGGIIGYGIVTSGPGPPPSVFEDPAAVWVFGLAAVCGIVAALSPDGFWRRARGWSGKNRIE